VKVAELSPLERHLRVVRTIGAHRPAAPDYVAYGRMKAELVRDFPDLEPAEYSRAVREIARATGV
jgi:hypothetical protein